MMVNQHTRHTGFPDFIMQDSTTRQTVEIQHHDTFGFGNGLLAGIGIFLEYQKRLRTWHPMQEPREIIGNHHLNVMTSHFQELRQSQNRPDGITVRVDMADQDNAFRQLNYSIKAFEKYVSLHNFN